MSTLKVGTIQNASGVEVYTAKAWVNFNGTGTVAIRASGNVSSITDNGTGDYTVNFTTAMPDANYGFNFGFNNQTSNNGANLKADIYSASNIRVQKFENNINADCASVCVAIFR